MTCPISARSTCSMSSTSIARCGTMRSATVSSVWRPPRSCSRLTAFSPTMSCAVRSPSITPVTATTKSSRTPRAIIVRLASEIVALARIVAAATWRRSVMASIAGESSRIGLGPVSSGCTTTPSRIRASGNGL